LAKLDETHDEHEQKTRKVREKGRNGEEFMAEFDIFVIESSSIYGGLQGKKWKMT